MLTVDDFNCDVREEIINGKSHWVYLGNDLAECIRFAVKVQENGEYFFDPLMMKIMGAHRVTLTKDMVLLLAAMDHYHRFNTSHYTLGIINCDILEVRLGSPASYPTSSIHLILSPTMRDVVECSVWAHWSRHLCALLLTHTLT